MHFKYVDGFASTIASSECPNFEQSALVDKIHGNGMAWHGIVYYLDVVPTAVSGSDRTAAMMAN